MLQVVSTFSPVAGNYCREKGKAEYCNALLKAVSPLVLHAVPGGCSTCCGGYDRFFGGGGG